MTNRNKLNEAVILINEVAENAHVSPSPFSWLMGAVSAIEKAKQYALDGTETEQASSGLPPNTGAFPSQPATWQEHAKIADDSARRNAHVIRERGDTKK